MAFFSTGEETHLCYSGTTKSWKCCIVLCHLVDRLQCCTVLLGQVLLGVFIEILCYQVWTLRCATSHHCHHQHTPTFGEFKNQKVIRVTSRKRHFQQRRETTTKTKKKAEHKSRALIITLDYCNTHNTRQDTCWLDISGSKTIWQEDSW